MKIMLLGYTTAGKTYFLGSLFKLAHEVGEGGFSVQHKDFTQISYLEQVYESIEGGKPISTTVGLKTAQMVLKKGVTPIIEELNVTDIEGQAIKAGGNVDVADKIVKITSEYDGFIILVDAPADEKQLNESSRQLAQSLAFISTVLGDKEGVPVSLVLNKLDTLPQAKGLKAKIDKKRQELISQNQTSPERIISILRTKLGAEIAPLIKPLIETVEIYTIIERFFNQLGRTPIKNIPHRVFVCTSLGFDTVASNAATTPEQLMPYGTGAAFLWTLYASLKGQQQQAGISGLLKKTDTLADELLEDIRKIYSSGKAYYNDDKELWSLRLVGHLYHNQSWGK